MDEQICKLTALLNKMLLREARDLLIKIGNPKRFAQNMTRVLEAEGLVKVAEE
jgi:hypothetical protein